MLVFEGDLIAAGYFAEAGGVPVSNVARWNGASWSALGDGVLGTAYCLAEYAGDLIVAGNLSQAGGNPVNRIAGWDGSAWFALGSGTDDYVWAVDVYKGELVAAGDFTEAGGVPVGNIARWIGRKLKWDPQNERFVDDEEANTYVDRTRREPYELPETV